MTKQGTNSATVRHRILLADDHPVSRLGLATLFKAQPDMQVCGETSSCEETLAAAEKLRPNAIVLEINMNRLGGLELLSNLRAKVPEASILVLSNYDETLYAERALRLGARGFVMKLASPEALMAAMRRVLAGGIYVSPQVSSRMLEKIASAGRVTSTNPAEYLSDREVEVFNLIGQGQSTREIAERMKVSVKTVESHRAHIKAKLNLRNASELTQLAVRLEAGI